MVISDALILMDIDEEFIALIDEAYYGDIWLGFIWRYIMSLFMATIGEIFYEDKWWDLIWR